MKRGQKLAAEDSNRNWKIGDWLVEGENEFEECFEPLSDCDRHLLIQRQPEGGCTAAKQLNFWKEISAELNLGKQHLREIARTARAFPDPKKRFAKLSFTHHMIAAGYERQYEYLEKCLAVPPGDRPRSVEWLQLISKPCVRRS